ncbi:MAG: AsmA-like C-terminal domain-containing protein, partial [Stellaceae bacterium]
LQPLAALELPLAGEAGMTLDADARRITGFWCNVKLGKGHIVDPKLAGGALTVIKGALSMAFNGKTKALQLRHFAATLDEPDGPKLDLTATIKDFDPEAVRPLAFSGDLQVHDLKASDFPKLWPRAVTAKARAWILKHILKGEIDHTDIRLAGTIVPNGQHGMMAHIGKVAGRFSFHGASVNYFDPLAPVDDIDGTARFDRKHMDILPDGGISRDVKVSDAAIHLTELNTNHEQAAIAVKLSGPLSTILDELNKKPLGYARALGIDPAHVAGTAIAHVQFHLPMKMDLNFSQVRYAAQGRLDNVAVERVFFNRDLSAGNLRLDVVPGRLKIDGTAKLQGVPVALAWTERFGDGGLRTRYHLHGRFDDAARRRLGIGVLPNHIRGPIGVDLTFLRKRSGNADSHVTLDLGPTALTLERLGWTKKSGQPATASFDIRARKGLPTRITNIRLDGGGLEARADIKMTGSSVDAGIARIDVRHLRVGRNDLHGVITRRPRGWAIWATGNSFDAAPLFDELQAARPNRVRDPRLWITANLGRVYLAPDRVATAVRARLYSDGWHWKSASIDARTAPGDMLRLRFGTAGKTPQFHLSTNNLGALLRLLDISNKVRGGHLSVIGHAEDLGNRRVLRGRFVGKDYRVIDVPAFARLLSAASLTGAAALLSGEGIPFSRVEGNFVMADGAVELSNARAFGEAIGINASGLFDYRDQRINLTGTIVPAYLFNSFLSNIPVLGNLLLGGKGEGIFAANYRVAGPMANPGISVNPLSALAPGFLRRLFLFAPGTPDTNDAGRNAAPKGG